MSAASVHLGDRPNNSSAKRAVPRASRFLAASVLVLASALDRWGRQESAIPSLPQCGQPSPQNPDELTGHRPSSRSNRIHKANHILTIVATIATPGTSITAAYRKNLGMMRRWSEEKGNPCSSRKDSNQQQSAALNEVTTASIWRAGSNNTTPRKKFPCRPKSGQAWKQRHSEIREEPGVENQAIVRRTFRSL